MAKSAYSSNRPGASSLRGKELNQFCPPNSRDDLSFLFCINPFLYAIMPVIISQLRQSGFCLVSYSTVHTRISGPEIKGIPWHLALTVTGSVFYEEIQIVFVSVQLTSNLSFQISNCSLQDPIPSENKIATIRYPAQH